MLSIMKAQDARTAVDHLLCSVDHATSPWLGEVKDQYNVVSQECVANQSGYHFVCL